MGSRCNHIQFGCDLLLIVRSYRVPIGESREMSISVQDNSVSNHVSRETSISVQDISVSRTSNNCYAQLCAPTPDSSVIVSFNKYSYDFQQMTRLQSTITSWTYSLLPPAETSTVSHNRWYNKKNYPASREKQKKHGNFKHFKWR